MKFSIHARKGGFSLIEMILVISVVSFLLAMAAPSLFSLISGSELGSEGEIFRSRLSLAQQQALSTNADVEVRFYKFMDSNEDHQVAQYRAMQFYQYNDLGDLVPVSELFRLSNPLIFSGTSKYSTLMTDSNVEKGTVPKKEQTEGGPTVGKIFGRGVDSATYRAFRFRPDGSTSLVALPGDGLGEAELSGRTWYLTIMDGQFGDGGDVKNYFCIQIDPFNGTLRPFRP